MFRDWQNVAPRVHSSGRAGPGGGAARGSDGFCHSGGSNVRRKTPVLTGWEFSSNTSDLLRSSRRSPVFSSTHTELVTSPFPIGIAPVPSLFHSGSDHTTFEKPAMLVPDGDREMTAGRGDGVAILVAAARVISRRPIAIAKTQWQRRLYMCAGACLTSSSDRATRRSTKPPRSTGARGGGCTRAASGKRYVHMYVAFFSLGYAVKVHVKVAGSRVRSEDTCRQDRIHSSGTASVLS